MLRQLKTTADGSSTLYSAHFDENFHSIHGAIQESEHVFIQAGLEKMKRNNLTIFEVGFGTGLNALLSYIYTVKNECKIDYHTVEKYPLSEKEYSLLNFPVLLGKQHNTAFLQMHTSTWGSQKKISENFTLTKHQSDISHFNFENLPLFNLIYFDAFAPEKQAEMWTETIFYNIYKHSEKDTILVTYCAKGQVRRILQSIGFTVERIPGPKGKREMLRAVKQSS